MEQGRNRNKKEKDMEHGHGGDIYTYKGMLDFSVNVNPFGPSAAVLEAEKGGEENSCAYADCK